MVTLPLFEETGRRGAGAAGSEGVTSLFLPQRTLPRVFFSFPYTFISWFFIFIFFDFKNGSPESPPKPTAIWRVCLWELPAPCSTGRV